MDELAMAVDELWTDAQTRRRMAEAARRHAKCEHDLNRVTDAYLGLFMRVLRVSLPAGAGA